MRKLTSKTNYYGSKRQSGSAQIIINQIPPHKLFIELFGGSGTIIQLKRPAEKNIYIEKSAPVYDHFKSNCPPGSIVINGCGIAWLEMTMTAGIDIFGYRDPTDIVIYVDPPYVKNTRRSSKDVYDYEMKDADHIKLLALLKGLQGVRIAISGYIGPLYNDLLKDWRRIDYMTKTRVGMVKESLWMNYEEPEYLHDYNFLGSNFTERQRIKRKIGRHVQSLNLLPATERNAIINAITGYAAV